jgi:hypothetical protein
MGVSFLAPLFLAGLVAVAVPILIHLTNRDRRDVVRFPSLKFLTKLPYRQMRRQRIQHWLLFTLRTLAIILLVAAFSRPLIEGALVAITDDAPGREVVIALDRSYSMAYGDTWQRAIEAAAEAIQAQPSESRLSLIVFDEQAQVVAGPVYDPAVLTRALDTLVPGSHGTRLAAVTQLANQLLLESQLEQREVIVVSDWQARAWDRTVRTQLPPGTTLTPVDLSIVDPSNVLITGVDVRRSERDGRQTVVVSARVVNQGSAPITDLPVTLSINGQDVAETTVTLPQMESRMARLGPVAQPSSLTRATVGIGDDFLAPDNTFYLALSSRPALSVLLIEARSAPNDGSLYLRDALAITDDPAFAVTRARVHAVRPADVEAASVVMLHDSPFPGGPAGQAIIDHVAGGGGLWIILGSRSPIGSWPETAQGLLPGRWRRTVDRLDRQGVSMASVDYDHQAFRVFSGPDDGNVAGPRFFRYRPIVLADSAQAIARYTDGGVALADRGYGAGRVRLWGSPFDNRWSNLPVQPVFLPFVHQVAQYLSGEQAIDGWRNAGQVVHLPEILVEMGIDSDTLQQEVIVEGPSRWRREVDVRASDPFITLAEAGFYAVYPLGRERASFPVAVNVDRAESDLVALDIEAFVAAVTAPDTSASSANAAGSATVTPSDRERRQGMWWFLIWGALALLVIESLWSNRPTQAHPVPAGQRPTVSE